MTENQTVGDGAGSGASETPNSQVSQQAQAPIEGDVTKMLAEFGGKLDSLGKELRGLQGRQDRSETSYGDFQKQLARLNQYKSQGFDDAEALAEMEADDAAASRWKTLEQKIESLAGRLAGVGTQADTQQMVAAALNEYGLDPKDPYVAGRLAGQTFTTKEQAELFAARIFRDKATNQTNQAQQAANVGMQTLGATDTASLFAAYQAEVAPHRGNVMMVSDIQAKYRKQGLNI